MARSIKLKDVPTILMLTVQRVRQNGVYENPRTVRALARGGIAYTKHNAFLYDSGGAVAGLMLIGCLALLLTNAPFRTFSFLQALETNTPLSALTLLFVLVRQRLPAFALSLSEGLLFGLIGVLPTSCIIALVSAAHRYDTRVYDRNNVDWLGLVGWSIGALLVALVPVGLMWFTKKNKQVAFTNFGNSEKVKQHSLVVLILAPCLIALTLLVLTAHHGSVLRYLLSFWGSHSLL
jgi:hypothetical protein